MKFYGHFFRLTSLDDADVDAAVNQVLMLSRQFEHKSIIADILSTSTNATHIDSLTEDDWPSVAMVLPTLQPLLTVTQVSECLNT